MLRVKILTVQSIKVMVSLYEGAKVMVSLYIQGASLNMVSTKDPFCRELFNRITESRSLIFGPTPNSLGCKSSHPHERITDGQADL